MFRDLLMRTGANEYYFNIGLSELSLERYDLVYESFSIFLELPQEGLVAEYAPRAREMRDQASEKIGFINVADDGVEFEVVVDGEQRGTTPLDQPIAVLPGEHTIAFVENGETTHESTDIVALGETVDVTVPAPMVTAAPPATKPEPAPQQGPSDMVVLSDSNENQISAASLPKHVSPLKPIGIVSAGLGAAALITSAITGKMAFLKTDKFEKACEGETECNGSHKDSYDKAEAYVKATNILLISGAGLVITGVITAAVGHKKVLKLTNSY